jgi:hypothetical protein
MSELSIVELRRNFLVHPSTIRRKALPDAVWKLVEDGQTEAVMSLLKGHTAYENTKKFLLQTDDGERLDPSNREDIHRIVAHLARPGVTWRLADMKGQAEGVMALIEALPQVDQKTILAAHLAVRGLTRSGYDAKVLSLIKTWPQAAQGDILTAPNVVRDLGSTVWGAKEVVALVKALPPDAQRDILAAPYASLGLAESGQAAEVEKIEAGWTSAEAKQKSAVRPLHVRKAAAPGRAAR